MSAALSTRVRALRVASGISQGKIAELVGKSQAWLSLVESGQIAPDGAETRAIFNAISTAAKDRNRKFRELLTQGIEAGVCA